jgi:tight adherence protein B
MLLFAFVLIWVLGSLPLLALLRTDASTKAIRRRIVAVREAARQGGAATILELEDEEEQTWTARLDALLRKLGIAERVERLISHAGSEMSLSALFGWSLGTAAAAALLVSLFFPLKPFIWAGACAGLIAPVWLLRIRRGRRLSKFTDALPEAVDLMARSLRAGHAVGAAIEIVAEQGAQPLAGEFDRVFQQQRFGLRFRDALLEMADRVPSPDLHFLITAILVQRETGGDLPDILDRTSEVIRERVRIGGEVRVHTAQGRLTGWILSLLPLALLFLINLIDPGYSKLLFHDPTGLKMLYLGGGLMVTGAFVISRIVKVEV